MQQDKKLILKMWSATAVVVCAIMVFTLASINDQGTLGVPAGITGGSSRSHITVSETEEKIIVIEDEPVALAASAEVSKPIKREISAPTPLSAIPVVRELRITIQKADGSYMAKYTGCSNVEQDIFTGVLDFEREGKSFHFSGIVSVQATILGDIEYRYYLLA
jgi:hypothetical protein